VLTGNEVPPMELPDELRVEKGYVRYAPRGSVALSTGTTMVSCAIAFCREHRHRRLLVNAVNLTGFDPPSLGDRYRIALEWAKAGAGQVVLAVVARPEFIHTEKFGVFVALRSGLRGDIFTTEPEAREWLLRQEPLGIMRPERSAIISRLYE
jgi:hypothetical protein